MDVKNSEDLYKLIDQCRKKGVVSLKLGEISFELHPSALYPESAYKKKKQQADISSDGPIQTDQVFDENAALFWSSAGIQEAN